MRKQHAWILSLAIALMGVLPGLASAGDPVPKRLDQPISTATPDQKLFNEAVLLFSNAARKQHGRPPLEADPRLAKAASDHARNMARLKTHSHVLPVRGQKDLKQRMKRQDVDFRLAAENIAMDKVYRLLGRPISVSHSGCAFTYGDTRENVPIHTYASLAQQVVDRWLKSPKHRKSLLSSKFVRLGAGIGVDPNGPACGDFYLVQDFAD
ncbi:MAG: CAP domain-containing protein [Rhodobacteraceae bacterium]|nr:CAP domain-containing protein [Paracoccaceae bacterium]